MISTDTALRRWLPIGLATLPLILLIFLATRLSVDVPFGDQWELVPRLQHMHAGTFRFADDLWPQHNEHRPIFPLLLMLALAQLSSWNLHWEVTANLVMGAGIFLVYAAHLRRSASSLWLLPVLAVLLFSPVQWENWFWGWQLALFMGTLASLAGLHLLASAERGSWRFPAAVACGVWTTFSFAAGLVYWPAGVAGIVLGDPARRGRRLIAWGLAGGVSIAAYFHHYVWLPAPPHVVLPLPARLSVLGRYVLSYIGSPVACYDHPAIAGGAGLALLAALVALLWRERATEAFRFPVLAALATLGVACLSAYGRAWYGVEQALSSRYTTFAVPFWCTLALLLVLWADRHGTRTASRRPAIAAAAVLVLLTAATLRTGRVAVGHAAARSDYIAATRRALIAGQSNAIMGRLYPDVGVLRQRRAILRMLGMSVFRN